MARSVPGHVEIKLKGIKATICLALLHLFFIFFSPSWVTFIGGQCCMGGVFLIKLPLQPKP